MDSGDRLEIVRQGRLGLSSLLSNVSKFLLKCEKSKYGVPRDSYHGRDIKISTCHHDLLVYMKAIGIFPKLMGFVEMWAVTGGHLS